MTSISTIGQNQEVLAENEVAKKHKIDALQQAKARMTDALDGKKQQAPEEKPTEVPQPQQKSQKMEDNEIAQMIDEV